MLAIDILERSGLEFMARWAHVVVGITWIGLLYYFNFVQVPAFAQFDGGSRNVALDKLASRALWWFRWAAAATFAFGIMILLLEHQGANDKPLLFEMDYYKTPSGISIATGMLLGITMFFNVWLVIWPNQKIVIANARNVIAGGEADPNAAAAGRKGLMASRQNTIFSLPMLFFMVGTSHFFGGGFDTSQGQDRAFYWVFVIVMWSLLEANCLGYLGGTAPGGIRKLYDDHRNTITAGFILVLLFYLVYEVAFVS